MTELGNKPVTSPDSLSIAYIKNYNLYIKDKKSNTETQLSYDGSKGFYYSSYIQWAPNGKDIMAYKVRPGEEHTIYFVESSPSDQFQPKLQSRDYLKPGDQLPLWQPTCFSTNMTFPVWSGKTTAVPSHSNTTSAAIRCIAFWK
jgi:hypothetical protein